MATTITVSVTAIPTLTGDTVASYNAYSSVDGLLGTLSVAEASAGKDFSLSDGATHSITVKAVWSTAGETTTVGSNAVSVTTTSSTILFEYDFAGTTPDSAKLAIVNPSTSKLTITQDGEFKGKYVDSSSTFGADYANIVPNWDYSTERWYSFDLTHNAQENGTWGVYFMQDVTDAANRIQIAGISTNTTDLMFASVGGGGGQDASQTIACDVSTVKTFKIKINSTTATAYLWNGSSYAAFGTALTHDQSGDINIGFFFRTIVGGSNTDEMNIDNVYVSSADFSTQYPT